MASRDVSAKLYQDLRRLAQRRMAAEPADHTLQPTALVHEAWLRLQSADDVFESRTHLFAAVATAMRRVLIDRARRVRRKRHGGELQRAPLDEEAVEGVDTTFDAVSLAGALERLEELDPQLATVVTIRYLLGCTIAETAEALEVSPSKVKKDLAFARAWLRSHAE